MPFELRGGAAEPVFARIARTIGDDIRRGRLRPGARLPGSRRLAESLGAHRNTVLRALAELQAEGWLETAPGRGTFVSARIPAERPRRASELRVPRDPGRVGFALPRASREGPPPSSAPLPMGGGTPDVRLVPTAELARALRRALRDTSLLDYGDARGDVALREALARHVARTRGVAADADDVLVTRGSQMALDLLARSVLSPGDVVAVEAWGYRAAWAALRASGVQLVPVAVDRHGLSLEHLDRVLASHAVRALYLTPHHQYPTTVTLSAPRRLGLLERARRHRFAILEDDYDHEFHYDGRPVLPLASADDAGVVIHFGTLSKILAPGLRVGYVVAPRPVLERMTRARVFVDRQGDLVLERALAELFEDGEVTRHAHRMRRVYHARRDAMATELRAAFGDALDVRVPSGGMALWVRTESAVDVASWAARALERGVFFQPGQRFAFDGRAQPFLRLGFAALDDLERQRGIAILRETWR
ncbi:MAG: PLP-dependent aminotransferase family protein [Polyangiaceae bacterium]|nr:PLP-dependent aminotransferase family protein [Polyangiaceae bacterium]